MKGFNFSPRIVNELRHYNKEKFMADLMAGLIVGIVALPLAIAFGIASGVSPSQGILTAIIGGFIVSALGGSKVQIGGKLSVYVEPSFVPVGELEAAVSTNRNVISFETTLTGKESFCGQGAGRFPTAYNAVADCLDIASGVHGFYTDTMKPAKPDNRTIT